jgi:hypothetical protein
MGMTAERGYGPTPDDINASFYGVSCHGMPAADAEIVYGTDRPLFAFTVKVIPMGGLRMAMFGEVMVYPYVLCDTSSGAAIIASIEAAAREVGATDALAAALDQARAATRNLSREEPS